MSPKNTNVMDGNKAFLDSDVLMAAPEAWPIPQEVAGIKLPNSTLALEATDFSRAVSAPVVFNHVLRTYLFGELLGRARGWSSTASCSTSGRCCTISA